VIQVCIAIGERLQDTHLGVQAQLEVLGREMQAAGYLRGYLERDAIAAREQGPHEADPVMLAMPTPTITH
jgi:hypothetical protein